MTIRTVIGGAQRAVIWAIRRSVTDGLPWSRSEEPALTGPLVPSPVDKLVASALFDPQWYAHTARCSPRPREAARHYLRRGAPRGLHPHPLFASEYAVARCPTLAEGTNPLLTYLEERLFDEATHPNFDVKSYLRAHPEARQHRDGPIGHYVEVGVAAGFAPNAWYRARQGETRSLVDWSAARHEEWLQRLRQSPRERCKPHDSEAAQALLSRYTVGPSGHPSTVHRGTEDRPPLVSVVVEALLDAEALTSSLRSVIAQELQDWEIVVVADALSGPTADRAVAALPGLRVTIVRTDDGLPAARLNLGVRRASGQFVAWLSPGEHWEPHRLRLLVAVCRQEGVPIAYDSLLVERDGRSPVFLGARVPDEARPRALASVDLSRMLVEATVFEGSVAFDPTMLGAWTVELSFRLMKEHTAFHVPVLGGRRDASIARRARRLPIALRPFPEHATVATWADVGFNRHAVDWDDLAGRPSRPDVVSVIVPTYGDWRMTLACVRSLAQAEVPMDRVVECIVWDNGSDAATSQVLDSLPLRFADVRVLHTPVNLGFALGNNLAVAHARGDTVVFLNNDTRVDVGWLPPLLRELDDEDVLGVQSLLRYPSGSVQSGGVVFPSCGGVPYNLLAGFPVEDARRLDGLELSALTGAALAMRFRDVVALHGFDPLFRNGMEDVDLCLRLHDVRPGGSFRVSWQSQVVHDESRTPGRFVRSVVNRQLFLDRWASKAPRDDEDVWSACGFEVIDHVVRNLVSKDLQACVHEPVLRRLRPSVLERYPRLRWAMKIAPPAGEWAEGWGDTHFARRFAEALRELDQEVVIDHRHEFGRRSGHLDDVVVSLRGLESFQPQFGQVSLLWVISHPGMVSYREAAAYDRVLAASHLWSSRMSLLWGLPVEPLLQATDPTLFHPGRARADGGHPVLFVGGSRREFRRIIKDSVALGLPLSVYGRDWEEFIPVELIKAQHVPNELVGSLYAAAGVVLNDHWDEIREQGLFSNRLFDAAASGARVITDDVAGLDGLFGSSVQVARDAEELSRLTHVVELDRVFGGIDERREVALRVHRDHSFGTRAARMLEIALEVRAQRGVSW